MKHLLRVMMWVGLLCVVASCANRGKLITPSQMVVQEAKKAKREEAKAAKKAQQEEKDSAADASSVSSDGKAEDVLQPPVAATATGKH